MVAYTVRHAYVEHDNATCKFWLEPIGLARSHGFGALEEAFTHRRWGRPRPHTA